MSGKMGKKQKRRLKKPYRRMLKTIGVIAFGIVVKWIWVTVSTTGHGSFEDEKAEILRRRNCLVDPLLTNPGEVLAEMPSGKYERLRQQDFRKDKMSGLFSAL